MSTSFEKLTLTQRIQAANIDCMRHPKFALLSGVICLGKSEVSETTKTAYTDGTNKVYGANFIKGMTRKQLRYLVLHENGHVAYKHCVLPEYHKYVKEYGSICNVAMDFVINGLIEELDPNFTFVERPTEVPPLVCDEFKGMSFPQVLRALIKQGNGGKGKGKGNGKGDGGSGGEQQDQTFDEHVMSEELTDVEVNRITKAIDDALRQGELTARKLAGNKSGNRDVFGLASQRDTNWREHLRDFVTQIVAGDDQSRFCPPNKRLLASGFIMPSHFSESVGELLIACDTSGSMSAYYGMLFGEISRICQDAHPESVRVLWWDAQVCGEQVFKPEHYADIAKLVNPVGGGGTTPACVTDYIAQHQLKPRAIIWLTDGVFFGGVPITSAPSLWGIVENEGFVAGHGKVLHIKA